MVLVFYLISRNFFVKKSVGILSSAFHPYVILTYNEILADTPGLKLFFQDYVMRHCPPRRPFHPDHLVDIRLDSVSPEYQIDFVGLLHIKLRLCLVPCLSPLHSVSKIFFIQIR